MDRGSEQIGSARCTVRARVARCTLVGLCALAGCSIGEVDPVVEVRPGVVAGGRSASAGLGAYPRRGQLRDATDFPDATPVFHASAAAPAHDAGPDAAEAGPSLDASADAAPDAPGPTGPDAATTDANVSDAALADAEIPDAEDCTPWVDTVEPSGGVRCVQEPPPDVGPFGYRVALTFDDGPNPATTPQVVATLRAAQIPATFFMVGWRLEDPAARAIALDIHRDPLFRVANHTYTHTRLTDLGLADAQLELERTTAALQLAVQDPCYFPRFFRFPHGSASCETVRLVRERGFGVAGVNIDALDWCYAAAAGYCPEDVAAWVPVAYRNDMIGYVLSQLAVAQGGIVLMHDIHANTAATLPALITALRAAGVTFVALDDTAVFPQLVAEVQAPEPPACCAGAVR